MLVRDGRPLRSGGQDVTGLRAGIKKKLSLHSACQIKDLKRRSSTVAKRLAQRKPFFTPADAFIMQSSVHKDAR